MGHVLVMKIEKERRVNLRFKDRQILRMEVFVFKFAGIQREEKRQIDEVRIKQPEFAQVIGGISGQRRSPCVKKVVALFREPGVVLAKNLESLSDSAPDNGIVFIVEEKSH